jgi:hypothetical protein
VFRDHPGGGYALLAQRARGGAGSRLLVLLPWRCPPGWTAGRLAEWPISTVWAAQCFHAALRHGWDPDKRGPDTQFTLAELLPDTPLPFIARFSRWRAAQRGGGPGRIGT